MKISTVVSPLPKENLAPGRLDLTARFSDLPRPVATVRDGVRIGVPTEAGAVTAILPATVWRKLERTAQAYPNWVAAPSGSLERFADGEIALKHPTLQIFEKKARPKVAAEAKPPEPDAPNAPAPAPTYPQLSLKKRGAAKAS